MKTDISEKYFDEAKRLMPGGVNSPVRAFNAVGRTPLFIKSAKGSKIYDEDGNVFIDYVLSWGPSILGHARKEVIDAVKDACDYGLTYGAPTKKESVLAGMIQACMPHMELMRMVSSGTEATMSAIRAARGFTGRDKIIKFSGCYHGHSDGLLVKSGSGLLSNAAPDSAGVPKGYTDNTLVAAFNDEESVKALFEKYPDEIACIIIEPVAANMGVVLPQNGFLHFCRDITKKYGAVLIFDEVITGFRLGLSGAGGYFGVTPDMTTLGKVVGGGMPVGTYGGRKEIMECVSPLGKVYQAGTLSGNPIAMTAGIKTLELLINDEKIYSRIDKKAAKIEKAFLETGIVNVNRIGSLMSAFFTDKAVTDYASALSSDTKAYSRYFSYMLENGIYIAPSQFEAMFVSDAHTDEDIQKTCDVIRSYKE